MANQETNIKFGDFIRAYDFMGRKDCYVEGRIIEDHDSYWMIAVMKDVAEDVDVTKSGRILVKVPKPGRLFVLEYDGRVEKIK